MHVAHWLGRLLFIATAFTVSCRHKPRELTSSDQSKLARGEHLAVMAGCDDCHTPGGMYGSPDRARTMSGSELGWRGPWGTSFPPNLTPDTETGIGAWSEDEIVRAIRQGLNREGHALLPPMPWPSYAHLTDEEAYSIAAYLKSLPAVRHRSPAAVPPDQTPQGAFVTIPPPPAWDAPHGGGVGGGPK